MLGDHGTSQSFGSCGDDGAEKPFNQGARGRSRAPSRAPEAAIGRKPPYPASRRHHDRRGSGITATGDGSAVGALSHVGFSGRTVGLHFTTGERHQELCTYEEVTDAIERVTIGAKEIQIRLSDTVAGNSEDRTLAIPWTRPSARRKGWRG